MLYYWRKWLPGQPWFVKVNRWRIGATWTPPLSIREYGRACSYTDSKNFSLLMFSVMVSYPEDNTSQHSFPLALTVHLLPCALHALNLDHFSMSLGIIKGEVFPSTCSWSYFKTVQTCLTLSSCFLSIIYHYKCFLRTFSWIMVIVVLSAYLSLHCRLCLHLLEWVVVAVICLW